MHSHSKGVNKTVRYHHYHLLIEYIFTCIHKSTKSNIKFLFVFLFGNLRTGKTNTCYSKNLKENQCTNIVSVLVILIVLVKCVKETSKWESEEEKKIVQEIEDVTE